MEISNIDIDMVIIGVLFLAATVTNIILSRRIKDLKSDRQKFEKNIYVNGWHDAISWSLALVRSQSVKSESEIAEDIEASIEVGFLMLQSSSDKSSD